MSVFTEAELAYLQSQRLGRLATVNKNGEPQNSAVGFRYNAELDTIDIGGYDNGNTQKFRNIARNGLASFLVDDVLPPWKPRFLEIRGHALALAEDGKSIAPNMSPALIRIIPKRIIENDAASEPLSKTYPNMDSPIWCSVPASMQTASISLVLHLLHRRAFPRNSRYS